MKNNLAQKLKDVGVIVKREVTLTSGKTAPFYCDMKRAYGDPKVFELLADVVAKKVPKKCTCIAATGYGGLPLAAAVSLESKKPLVLVRSTDRKHGTGGVIDGYIPTEGDRVCIIDDVFTTGGSIMRMQQRIERETGAQVLSALVVVKRGDGKIATSVDHILDVDELL